MALTVNRVGYKHRRSQNPPQPDARILGAGERMVRTFVEATGPAEQTVGNKQCQKDLPADGISGPVNGKTPDCDQSDRQEQKTRDGRFFF